MISITPRKVAIYTRVSTDDQDTALQTTELLEYAKKRGWEPIFQRGNCRGGAPAQRQCRGQGQHDPNECAHVSAVHTH